MRSRVKKLIYLLISAFSSGAALAALIALLFAPFSGRETRQKIGSSFKSLFLRKKEKILSEHEEENETKKNWFEKLVA